MKNVLIVVERFPTTGGSRIDNFVKYLPDIGWNPIVLTTKFNDNAYGRKILKYGFPKDIRVIRAFSLVKTPFRILSRFFGLYETTAFLERLFFLPDPSITWVLSAIFKGIKLIRNEKIGIIFSSSPPESAHLIALFLRRLTGKKWVADFRDLWTQYKARYLPPTPIHDKIIKRLERYIFERADHIIANTEENREIYIRTLNVPRNKISIITNGYDPENLSRIKPANSYQKKDEFGIGYMGNFDKPFFPWREFLYAYKEFVESSSKPKIRLNVYGYVSKKAIGFVTRHALTNWVTFHGEYPHSEAAKLAAQSDLLLLLLQEDDSSRAIVPLKLYTYLIMNKPVLAIAPKVGAVARIMNETQVGISVSLKEDGALLKALEQYYENWANNGKPAFTPNLDAIKNYSSRLLTQRLAEVFDKSSPVYPLQTEQV